MTLVAEHDLGTPPSKADTHVRLTIDGVDVTVPEGTSIMRAAREAGIGVPKLCATDSVKAFGSCRLCLVEIEGRDGTPASCTTPVAAGMKVRTQTPLLERPAARRDGALHLRPSARLPDLRRERRLRIAGHGGRRGLARRALRLCRREPSRCEAKDEFEPVLHLRSGEVHRLLALRARLRGNARHVRADDRRPRLRLEGLGRHVGDRSSTPNACRAALACRPARRRP